MTLVEVMNHVNGLDQEEKRELLDLLTTSLVAEEAPQLLQAELWRPQVPAEVVSGLLTYMAETEAYHFEHA